MLQTQIEAFAFLVVALVGLILWDIRHPTDRS
jgi:hypothetical protein